MHVILNTSRSLKPKNEAVVHTFFFFFGFIAFNLKRMMCMLVFGGRVGLTLFSVVHMRWMSCVFPSVPHRASISCGCKSSGRRGDRSPRCLQRQQAHLHTRLNHH